MNAAYAPYKHKGGFLNGVAAWFKCVMIGWAVLAILLYAVLMVGWIFGNGTSQDAIDLIAEPNVWGFVLGVPVAVMIYFLPFFIETRVSRNSEGMTLGLIMNVLLGWFPVFWFIMLMLAIFKNR